MISLRPLAGVILTSVLLTGYAAAPATASTQAPVASSSVQAASRPSNGKILYDRYRGGRGTLKIKNGTGRDAVVTLVRGRTKTLSLYVRARSTASAKVVEDGTYRVYFTGGHQFSTSKRRFAKSATYQRFDRKLRFTTTSTSRTVWTLTLNPIRGGNASTSGVDPKDFPA